MPKLCIAPGCPERATKKGRCVTHYRERERERNNNNPNKQHYNTKLWRLARRRQLFNEPLCANCGRVAEHVHHLLGVENDPRHTALQSLCAACHARVTREGEGRFLGRSNPKDAPVAGCARTLRSQDE